MFVQWTLPSFLGVDHPSDHGQTGKRDGATKNPQFATHQETLSDSRCWACISVNACTPSFLSVDSGAIPANTHNTEAPFFAGSVGPSVDDAEEELLL